jgi:hypothetical protein
MMFRTLADLVVLSHLGYILFVVFGAFLVLRWPRIVWLHLPAVAWAALIEFAGWTCPLTPLENYLRRAAGLSGYRSGFIDHHLVPVIYPAALSRQTQFLFGFLVIAINVAVYLWLFRRRRRKERARSPHPPGASGGGV